MITFTQIHQSTNNFNAGTIPINVSFVGNLLAIECTTKPEYVTTQQTVGYLYQFNGNVQKAYAITSGKDVIRLELPETTRMMFLPTPYLSDNYTLTLGYTNVGTVIDGSNSVSVPEELLALPVRVSDLEASQDANETHFDDLELADTELGNRVAVLEGSVSSPSWESIPDKPSSFAPSSHNHSISEVTGLTDAVADKADSSHTHGFSDITGLSTELGTLASDLGDLTERVETLESNPVTGTSQASYKGIVENITTPLAFYWDDSHRVSGDFVTKRSFGVVGTEPKRCLVDDSTGLQFLGTSSGHYVLNSHSGIEITGNITYLALFKTGTIPSPNTANLEGVLVKQTDSAGGIGISIGGSNALAEFTNDSGATTTLVNPLTLASNTNYLVRAYRNGAVCGIQVNALTPTEVNTFTGSLIVQNTPLRVGNKVSSTFGFRGVLKMAAIFNGHLSGTEYAYLSGLDFNQFPSS
jgi:hypothetical protein